VAPSGYRGHLKHDRAHGSAIPRLGHFEASDGQAMHLVRETKGTKDFLKLRTSEADKVRCGQKHFEAIGVDFGVVMNANEVERLWVLGAKAMLDVMPRNCFRRTTTYASRPS
jgi:uncharacterized protein (DUF924 family)